MWVCTSPSGHTGSGVCWRTLRTGSCEQLVLAVRLQQAGGSSGDLWKGLC